jgi:membrane-bound metal-dependent hydrolase YbcI (DUF457 family)
MVAGHFGLAAGVKAQERQVPLWALMLATAWLDVLFGPLFAMGIEGLQVGPGGGYGNVIIHGDYTHSLVGSAIIAAVFGLVASIPWGRRTGVVLGAVVFSHWVLDLVVHRADMAILPGNIGGLPRLGFGLWRVPAASAVVELAIVAVGSYLYWRAAVRTARTTSETSEGRAHVLGGLVLGAGVAVLALDLFVPA